VCEAVRVTGALGLLGGVGTVVKAAGCQFSGHGRPPAMTSRPTPAGSKPGSTDSLLVAGSC
jgi:hypothetical protein